MLPSDIGAIESFARAAAKMQDPFAERARTLAEMNLDDAGWQDLQDRWSRALADHAARGHQAFVETFRLAFQRARQDVRAQRAANPLRQALPQITPSPIDQTAEAQARPTEALPFQTTGNPPPPPFSPEDPPDHRNHVDQTALMTDAPWRKALPFGDDD